MNQNKINRRREDMLFWFSVVLWLYMSISVLSVSFGCKEVAPEATTLYSWVLGTYAVTIRVRHFGKPPKNYRSGESFVYLTWIVALIIVTWWKLSSDPNFVISKELEPMIKNVTGIFFGSEAFKQVDIFLQGREKKC